MNNFIDYAIEYASRGWAVFPLREKDKKPIAGSKGFKDATTDINKIREWWSKNPNYNIGIATGQVSKGLIVIDLDVDDDKNGLESLNDWQIENGCFPQSWQTVTGRGGTHLLFTSDKPVRSHVGCLKGVDVRAEGGYIVAPPSIHPNGNRYEWEWYKGDCELLPIDETVEFFLAGGYAGSNTSTQHFEMPEVVNKGGRNDMLFRMACSMQSKGLSDQAIIAAVEEENRTKCNPPLSDTEVRQILSSALSKLKGNSTTGTYSQPMNKEQPKPQKNIRKLKRASELMKKELEEPTVYVGVGEEIPLLVEGTCILSAKPKLGKSWLVLAMCLAISKGEDFLGYKTRKCSTLYLDLETSEQLQQKRIKKALNGSDIPENFYLDTETDSLDNGFVQQIEAYLKEDPEIGVVVIDVFQIIRSSAKNTKENEYEHAYRDITPLNELAKKHHLSIILVCHDRKMVDLDDPFANILGSTGLQGAVAQMMVMFRPRKDLPIHLSIKGKTIDGIVDLNVALESGVWKSCGDISTSEEDELLNEYMKSPIRKAALYIAQEGWNNGRCGEFKQIACENGIALTETPKQIGGFLSKFIGHFLKYDGVMVKRTTQGTGSNTYSINVVSDVDENDNPFL